MIGGGLESVVMNYYRHIDRSRVQFDFIVDDGSTIVPRDEIESLGGRVFMVPRIDLLKDHMAAIGSLYRKEGWPVVHSHRNALSVFPLYVAHEVEVPVRIAHSHSAWGSGETMRNVVKALLRVRSCRYPTHKMACSVHAGEWLFGKGSDFTVLHNAIELDRFGYSAATRGAMRSELGIGPDTLAVGHIGRFMKQKNHSFLIEAFDRLVSLRKDAVLVLAGEGELREECERDVRRRGIANKVLFLGQRDDINDLYQAFDVFAFPSHYEGFGIVVIEAQKSGLPCIVSEMVPSEADLTGTVRLLPIDDPLLWAAELSKVRVGERLEVSEKSFKNFNIDVQAPKVVSYYERTLAEVNNGRL